MHITLDQIYILIDQYKYWIIFPLAILEWPIVTVISAFFASNGYVNVYLIYAIALSGDIIGDMLHYVLGRWGGDHIDTFLWRRSGFTVDVLLDAKNYLNKNPAKAIWLWKWTHVMGFAVLIGSGMVKVPVKDFLWYCLVSSFPKVLLFVLIWYFFGSAYRQIDAYLWGIFAIIFTLIIILLAIYLFIRFKAKKIWKESHV